MFNRRRVIKTKVGIKTRKIVGNKDDKVLVFEKKNDVTLKNEKRLIKCYINVDNYIITNKFLLFKIDI